MRCEICGDFWFKKYSDAVAFSYSKTVKFRTNDVYIYVNPTVKVARNKKTGKMTCNLCSPPFNIFTWFKSIFLHKRGWSMNKEKLDIFNNDKRMEKNYEM